MASMFFPVVFPKYPHECLYVIVKWDHIQYTDLQSDFFYVSNIVNILRAIKYCSLACFNDFMVFHYLNES